MHHAILVTVLQSGCHLFEQLLNLFLRQPVVKRVDVFAHVHVLCVRNDIEVLLINVHVNKLDYVRMVQLLEHFQLADDLLKVRRLHLLFLDLFYCNEHVQLLVDGK